MQPTQAEMEELARRIHEREYEAWQVRHAKQHNIRDSHYHPNQIRSRIRSEMALLKMARAA